MWEKIKQWFVSKKLAAMQQDMETFETRISTYRKLLDWRDQQLDDKEQTLIAMEAKHKEAIKALEEEHRLYILGTQLLDSDWTSTDNWDDITVTTKKKKNKTKKKVKKNGKN